MPSNPLKAFLDIRRRELPLTLLMFTYFMLVIATFWVLKPIKENVFLGYYTEDNPLELFGFVLAKADAELIPKLLNILVAIGAVVAFSRLSRTLRREQLTLVFGGFVIACLVAFWLIGPEPVAAKWALYLFGDLFNTLMVATFFAFLNDSFTPSQAKRAYGPIILGGVVGGAVGSSFVQFQIDKLDYSAWLFIAMGATALIMLCGVLAGREVKKDPPPERAQDKAEAELEEKPGNAAIAGAKLVFRSRYLLSIVAIVAIYEIVSQLIDYQFKATSAALPGDTGGDARNTVYFWTNIVALVIQACFTSAIFKWIGVRGALLILPVLLFGFSAAYLVIPIWAIAGPMRATDNALNYSLNQSAREALYTVTSRREKYQAKAFIDMFMQRFAKGIAIVATLVIALLVPETEAGAGEVDSGVRLVSIVALVGVAVWFFAALYAGRRFAEESADEDASDARGRSAPHTLED